jgi:hypothetical protein
MCSQALDFAGLSAGRERAINKVIHIKVVLGFKGFRIKDLSGTSRNQPELQKLSEA